MDRVFQGLFGLLAALNAATGAMPDGAYAPDRPVIVAPTPILASNAKMSGMVQSIQSNGVVVNGVRVVFDAQAQVIGKLVVGVTVQLDGTFQSDGSVVASQVRVQDNQPDDKPETKTQPADIKGAGQAVTNSDNKGSGTPSAGSDAKSNPEKSGGDTKPSSGDSKPSSGDSKPSGDQKPSSDSNSAEGKDSGDSGK